MTSPTSLTESFLSSLIFSHDLIFGTFPRLFPPGWFIETQVQFYLIGPPIWLAYLKIAGDSTRLTAGVLLLLVFIIGSTLLATQGPAELKYSILAFLPYFWIGGLLADYHNSESLPDQNHDGHPGLKFGWWGFASLLIIGSLIENEILQTVW